MSITDTDFYRMAVRYLSEHPRARDLGIVDFHSHVRALAEEFQIVAENFDLPTEGEQRMAAE